jgi:Uma2 family endonuclease
MSANLATLIDRWHFTVADYHRMGETGILGAGDRVELIEGEIVAMPPIGSPHGGRVNRLNRLLSAALGDRAVLSPQNPIVLGEHSEPEPDLAVLRPRADFYTESHPQAADALLLIEVADSSIAYDLQVKVPLYARHGIPEVWVVDIPDRRVFRFSRLSREAGRYLDQSTLDLKAATPIPGLSDCSVVLAGLF